LSKKVDFLKKIWYNYIVDKVINHFSNINKKQDIKEIFIMAVMKENTKKVFEFLRTVNGQNVTAADVAEALGLEKRSIDGIFTSAIQKKGYGVRIPAEIELEDGSHKGVKFLQLTEAGMTLDLENPDAE
jgi:hypothetical protein